MGHPILSHNNTNKAHEPAQVSTFSGPFDWYATSQAGGTFWSCKIGYGLTAWTQMLSLSSPP